MKNNKKRHHHQMSEENPKENPNDDPKETPTSQQIFSRIKINDKFSIPTKWLNMNITLRNLIFDCMGVASMTDLEEVLMQKGLSDSNYYFSVPLPVQTATDTLLELVLKFCEYHISKPVDSNEEKLSKYDVAFIEDVITRFDLSMVYNLFTFADYLENEQLLTVCAIWIAQNEISGKTVAELRKKFNIQNDLTAEEEAEIEVATKWIEEYK